MPTVRNTTAQRVYIDNVAFDAYESKTIQFLSKKMQSAITAGTLALGTALATHVAGSNALVAGNGTPVAAVGGTRTLVATTDQTTTTNAIAGLVAEFNLLRADLSAVQAEMLTTRAQVQQLQGQVDQSRAAGAI